jgi:hypothetical protein
VINQEEIALGFNKLSYIRTLPKFLSKISSLNKGGKVYKHGHRIEKDPEEINLQI